MEYSRSGRVAEMLRKLAGETEWYKTTQAVSCCCGTSCDHLVMLGLPVLGQLTGKVKEFHTAWTLVVQKDLSFKMKAKDSTTAFAFEDSSRRRSWTATARWWSGQCSFHFNSRKSWNSGMNKSKNKFCSLPCGSSALDIVWNIYVKF